MEGILDLTTKVCLDSEDILLTSRNEVSVLRLSQIIDLGGTLRIHTHSILGVSCHHFQEALRESIDSAELSDILLTERSGVVLAYRVLVLTDHVWCSADILLVGLVEGTSELLVDLPSGRIGILLEADLSEVRLEILETKDLCLRLRFRDCRQLLWEQLGVVPLTDDYRA